MVLFIVLGLVVLFTFVVLGYLFFMLSKEEEKKEKVLLPAQAVQVLAEDDVYKKRVKELEDELRTITLKAEGQSDETKRLIETLTKENETLKSQQANLEQALLSVPKPAPDEALRHELESLKYELIKARAQSSGLERLSLNYKNQLEDFFKKVNAVQVSNDHLSQVKNRLEGMVQEIKVQNEELVKKDQLAQFELEKNRSRLKSLERECEDLKARTHQKDSQV